MLNIPEEIKALYLSDNTRAETKKKFKIAFYDDKIDSLYPYETLFPEEELFPQEHGTAWLTIENEQIEAESFQKSESLCEDENMVFGSCESAEVQITVADVNQDLTGKEFVLTVELGGYEMALGMYTVKSFVRESDRRKRKITAYDRMQWFNVDVADWYNNLSFPMTIKAFRDNLCEYIGIAQNDQTLLFDTMTISKTIEPETLQGIDVLKAICEINGCFGHVDNTGQLKYIYLQQTALYPDEQLFPEEDLYPSEYGGDGIDFQSIPYYKQPLTYEDYLVQGIDGITIRQEEGDVGASVGEGTNGYLIEGNFLVYGKNANELLNIGQLLLPYIGERVYRPASIDCNCMPWIEVGDAVTAMTKDDMIETFVMKRTMTGCQHMRDKLEATGEQTRTEQKTIHKQIIQLEGKTAVIIKNVDEVSARVTDLKEYTEAQFKITADAITAEVTARQESDEALSSRITINSQQIELKVSKGEVSSQLSIENDKVTLSSNRLIVDSTNFKLDGNGNATFSGNITGGTIKIGSKFSVDNAGNMKATSGQFTGNISGTEIDGGTITGSQIYGGDNIPFEATRGEVSIGDFYVSDEYGRHIFQSYDECTGMSTGDASGGEWYLWAGYGMGSGRERTIFLVNDGQVRVEGDLILNGRNILDIIGDGGGCDSDFEECGLDCDHTVCPMEGCVQESCSQDGCSDCADDPSCSGDESEGPGCLL